MGKNRLFLTIQNQMWLKSHMRYQKAENCDVFVKKGGTNKKITFDLGYALEKTRGIRGICGKKVISKSLDWNFSAYLRSFVFLSTTI